MITTPCRPAANVVPPKAAAPASAPEDTDLIRAVQQYLAALEAGQKLDRGQFLARHPELAEALAECLDALEFVHGAAPHLSEPAAAGMADGSVPSAELLAATPLGDFRIVREIGRGGMGVVYEAEQISLGRRVALKVLPLAAALDAKHLQRFKTEAQAAAHLHHTNIVPVISVGCEHGVHYYAMQLIDGQSLAALIGELRRRAGREPAAQPGSQATASEPSGEAGVPALAAATLETPAATFPAPSSILDPQSSTFFRTVAHLALQAAEALDHAHAQGVVHRDIKPANLLVDVRGNLWVTDFGLARLAGEAGLTLTGDVLGTWRYMSPEQARARRELVDHRTDLYSLGATLYELLTLEPAFNGKDRHELQRQIATEEPQPPRRRNPAIPADLETICLKAMAKEPGRRYPSAGALAEDLRRFLAGEPILARPVGQLERAWRWCRRNPAPAAAGVLAVVAFAALVALGVGSVFAMQLSQEQERTQAALQGADQQRQEAEGQRAVAQQQRTEADQQRDRADDYRRQTERLATTLAMERGLALCEQGNAARGMLWLARSLQMAPAHAADLQRASRASLAGWHRQIHPLRFACPHQSTVFAVAFSPDGKTLVTASVDGIARLWETATGKPFGQPLQHQHQINAVAFSHDGKTILTGSWDKTARLWEAATGKPLGTPLQHQGRVLAVAFSPDGRTILTGSSDQTARLWEATAGKPLGAPLPHQGAVDTAAFSPDGKTVLTGSVDKTARLWEAGTGKPLGAPLQHEGIVRHVAFSPDGKTVATASFDRTARLWAAATGKPLGAPLQHPGMVHAVAFSPDGKTILTGSQDGTARLWEAATGRPLGGPLQHQDGVHGVAFSPDGKTVLTRVYDGTARLWEVATGQPLGPPLQHKSDRVWAMGFSPDGKTVATGAEDGSARLWEVGTGKPPSLLLQHPGPVWAVTFSPDGRTVLTGSVDKTARLWEAATGKPLGGPLQHQGMVWAGAFSPDGRTVLTGSQDKTARLWEAATGKPLSPPLQHVDRVTAVAFSPDGKTILTAAGTSDFSSAPGEARLWEAATGKPLGAPLQHQRAVIAVAFSPDSKTVLTGSTDGTARLWETDTGKPLGVPLQHKGFLTAVAFSPDGKTVLTGGRFDQTAPARLWEAATGKPVGPPLRHQGAVWDVAFSPDGKTILTGSADRTARLWEAATGKPLGRPMPHQAEVRHVAFSPDGKTVLTGSYDKTARLWEATTGQPLGPPLPHEGRVSAVAFSPDGKTVLTGSNDKTARLWPLATPVQGEVERIVLWTQVVTGMELDGDDVVRVLDATTWQQRRQRLMELGGPPQ